jgi:hypothetical protein
MTTINKADSIFFYRTPADRLKQIMTLGWCAVWNGNLYTDYFDLNVTKDNKLKEVLAKIEENRNECFNNLENTGEKGTYGATISDILKSFSDCGFASESIDELKAHLLANVAVPEAIKADLR